MKPYGSDDIGLKRRETNAGVPRRRAAVAIAIFCIFAALMNGVSIRDSVALKPYGTVRRAWLFAAEPLATIAERTRLPWLRQTLEQCFHNTD